MAALAKFAWRPLLEALERRQDQIRKSLDDAQKAKQELEKLHVESQRILAAARADAEQILSSTRSDAIVGTLPKAFRHASLGDVDAYVMHRFL